MWFVRRNRMFLMGSTMLQMAWLAVWSLCIQRYVRWKHEKHQQYHLKCWYRMDIQNGTERRYFGCLSMQWTFDRHSFHEDFFAHRRLFWLVMFFFPFNGMDSVCADFFLLLIPTSYSEIRLFIRNKLVARFSMPTNRHYITRPKDVKTDQNKKKTVFPKERKRSAQISSRIIFQCAMNARTWNKYYPLDAPCWVWNSLWEYCSHTHFWLYTPTRHAKIHLFAFNEFACASFSCDCVRCLGQCRVQLLAFDADFESFFSHWYIKSFSQKNNNNNNIYSLHFFPRPIDAYLFSALHSA